MYEFHAHYYLLNQVLCLDSLKHQSSLHLFFFLLLLLFMYIYMLLILFIYHAFVDFLEGFSYVMMGGILCWNIRGKPQHVALIFYFFFGRGFHYVSYLYLILPLFLLLSFNFHLKFNIVAYPKSLFFFPL